MAKSLNEIKLIGNVGNAPEIKSVNTATRVAQFSVATSETFLNTANEKVVTTQWHKIVAWRKLAEIVEKYVGKGDKIYLTGKVTYRSYEGSDGVVKYITEIVATDIILLGGKALPQPDQQQSATTQHHEEDPDYLPF